MKAVRFLDLLFAVAIFVGMAAIICAVTNPEMMYYFFIALFTTSALLSLIHPKMRDVFFAPLVISVVIVCVLGEADMFNWLRLVMLGG